MISVVMARNGRQIKIWTDDYHAKWHKGPVTRKMFQFDDVIMFHGNHFRSPTSLNWTRGSFVDNF